MTCLHILCIFEFVKFPGTSLDILSATSKLMLAANMAASTNRTENYSAFRPATAKKESFSVKNILGDIKEKSSSTLSQPATSSADVLGLTTLTDTAYTTQNNCSDYIRLLAANAAPETERYFTTSQILGFTTL